MSVGWRVHQEHKKSSISVPIQPTSSTRCVVDHELRLRLSYVLSGAVDLSWSTLQPFSDASGRSFPGFQIVILRFRCDTLDPNARRNRHCVSIYDVDAEQMYLLGHGLTAVSVRRQHIRAGDHGGVVMYARNTKEADFAVIQLPLDSSRKKIKRSCIIIRSATHKLSLVFALRTLRVHLCVRLCPSRRSKHEAVPRNQAA